MENKIIAHPDSVSLEVEEQQMLVDSIHAVGRRYLAIACALPIPVLSSKLFSSVPFTTQFAILFFAISLITWMNFPVVKAMRKVEEKVKATDPMSTKFIIELNVLIVLGFLFQLLLEYL